MSRRSQRGRAVAYSDGDCVEILRSKGVSTGTLLKKIPDSNPESPRWLIALSDGNTTEEIGEKMLGKVIGEGGADVDTKKKARPGRGGARGNGRTAAAAAAARAAKPAARTTRAVSAGSASDPQDSQSSTESKASAPKTRAQPGASRGAAAVAGRKRRGSPVEADGADSGGAKNKTARTTDAAIKQQEGGPGQQRSTRAAARTNPNLELSELPMRQARKPAKNKAAAPNNNGDNKPNNKPPAKSTKEHVTKIKMKTGILYLFRGEKPRAEFVWSR